MANLPPALKGACTTGDLSLAKSLYNDLPQNDKEPLLTEIAILSARNAHPTILSFCFTSGLTLNSKNENDPLIYAACDSGSVAIFRVLLAHGLSVNKYLELGGGPLVSACEHGNVDLATFLLDEGADPNNGQFSGDYEALVWAVVGDHASLDMVKLLLARGTVVKGTGALIAAAEHGNVGAVNVLLECRDVALEEVEEYGGYDGRKLDDQGTALYKAAAGGHLEIVDILLRKGADAGFKDRKGRSVADVAEERGHVDIVRRLR